MIGGRRPRIGVRGLMIVIAVLAGELAILRDVTSYMRFEFTRVRLFYVPRPGLAEEVRARIFSPAVLAGGFAALAESGGSPVAPDCLQRLDVSLEPWKIWVQVEIRFHGDDPPRDRAFVAGVAEALVRSYPPGHGRHDGPPSSLSEPRVVRWGALFEVACGIGLPVVIGVIATRRGLIE